MMKTAMHLTTSADPDFPEQVSRIMRLKAERNALIVAHNYQRDEVQQIADFVGDSFALARICAESPADVLVFCGVHFMAESAKILSPAKTVLLPDRHAGCPMADMIDEAGLRVWKEAHPGIPVVCYINTSAAVKAESTVCCTSSNAEAVVRSLPDQELLFIPDCNLGQYIAAKVSEKKIHLWPGYCRTHHRIRAAEVRAAKAAQPDSLLLAHPECRPEVLELADFIGSTRQIIDYAKQSPRQKFLIGTEMGVLWQLRRDNPDKVFYLLSPGLVCPNMKKITLDDIEKSLANMRYAIEVPGGTARAAAVVLRRMLAIP